MLVSSPRDRGTTLCAVVGPSQKDVRMSSHSVRETFDLSETIVYPPISEKRQQHIDHQRKP